MIIDPKVEKLLKHAENRYELVTLVARRARQLELDASKAIESKVTRAANEVNNGDCYIIKDNIDA